MQGQGYGTEAAAACRDYAKENIDTDTLVAIIPPEKRVTTAERIETSPKAKHPNCVRACPLVPVPDGQVCAHCQKAAAYPPLPVTGKGGYPVARG